LHYGYRLRTRNGQDVRTVKARCGDFPAQEILIRARRAELAVRHSGAAR
jgi:hypothetical protein